MLRCVICTKGSSVTVGWVPICCGVARRVSDVGEPSQERVHGNVTVVDGCAFVLGERDVGEDPPQVALGFEQLGLGGLEIATGAGHRCWYCSKKLWLHQPWPRSWCCQGWPSPARPGVDGDAVDEDFDGAEPLVDFAVLSSPYERSIMVTFGVWFLVGFPQK